RVRAMMLIHNKLYFEKELTVVNIRPYLEELSWGLMDSYGFKAPEVLLELHFDDPCILTIDKAIPLGLICAELLSNTFKYAISPDRTNRISISIRKTGSQHLVFSYSDNGEGFDFYQGLQNSSSFGLQLIQSQIKQLRATLDFDAEHGTHYRISFHE